MAVEWDKMSFEEALRGLEKAADSLKSQETTLEDAIKRYEEGIRYFGCCTRILNSAKQKIEIFERSKEELQDFV